jgi:hypothetical protein
MKRISEEQFFAPYPKYQNLNDLKKADILKIPLHDRKLFTCYQHAFCSLTSDPNFNCRFYVEDKNSIPFIFEIAETPPDCDEDACRRGSRGRHKDIVARDVCD